MFARIIFMFKLGFNLNSYVNAFEIAKSHLRARLGIKRHYL